MNQNPLTGPIPHVFWCTCALVVMLSHSVALAAGAENIADIHVEGLRRVEPEAALKNIKTKTGDRYDPKTLTEDLHAVFDTGFFRDVRVEQERTTEGIRIIFVLEEKPSVKDVQYEGNNELGEDKIKEVVDIKPNTILNREQLKRNVDKIRDLYVEKGHYLAEVNYRVESSKESKHEVNIVFEVKENAKVMVRQITLVGNKALSSETIKGVLQTREGNELSWLTSSGTYKKEFFQTDLMRIQAIYYDHGYVNVKLGQPTITISPDRRYIYIAVTIEEGEQHDFGEIAFSGEIVLKDKEGSIVVDEPMLWDKLNIHKGETFNRSKLFQDVQAMADIYRDQGYAYANVTPHSVVHKDSRTVDLNLEIDRGDIVYFERIEIVGNTKTRDKVIRREMRVFEGDRYSASGLNESRARVYQLGFFETVNIATNKGSAPDRMNVTVEIKEKSTGTFQIGAGFSSVESFIATAQIAQNNFLGNGQLFSLSAQLSFGDYARQLATLQFYEPYLLDSEWSLGMNAYLSQRYYREFQRNANGLSPIFGYPITHDLRLHFGYTLEWIKIETDPNYGPALWDLNRGNGRNSALNFSVAYDTRDNRLFPSKGQYHEFGVEVSDRGLGSETTLEHRRLHLDVRYYYALPLSLVLKFNASFGLVFARDEERVAISERYFPGGIYSVRGFEPRGLGPTENVASKGDPMSQTSQFIVGGNKQAIFNLELEFPIVPPAGIKGVIFADAGNAYDDDEGFFYLDTPKQRIPPAYMWRTGRETKPPLGLYYSFGFGFRWFSPIGPLRFEWGIPITKRRPDDRGIIFEFTIGNFF